MSHQPPRDQIPLRARILLSVQTALLGEVTPSLVAVALRWTEGKIEGRFYYEAEPSESEQERVSDIETEIMASFPDSQVSFSALPNVLANDHDWVMALAYLRSS